jgi:excisionase family DNA binding protein
MWEENMATDFEPMTYTIGQAAKILNVGRNTAYEAAKSGQIPTIKIGKRILVPRVAFERLLAGEGALE